MSNQFDTSSDEIGAIGIDLTVSEFVISIVPVLIGMAVFAVIAVLMLL